MPSSHLVDLFGLQKIMMGMSSLTLLPKVTFTLTETLLLYSWAIVLRCFSIHRRPKLKLCVT